MSITLKKDKKILINSANLHVGGGIQVAVSFIYEMTKISEYNFSNIDIIVSDSVHQGLIALNTDISIFNNYRVLNLNGAKAFFSTFNNEIKKYDVVFTIFGPNYLRDQAKKEIVGFAQPWIIDFNNDLTKKMNVSTKIKERIKRYLQWLIFKRANLFIVELEHVKEKLINIKKINPSKIKIAYNSVSSIYFNKSQWSKISFEKTSADLHLGIISRNYKHKNLSILPDVAKLLLNKYNLHVNFYVTFNQIEWSVQSKDFKQNIINVGTLLPNECPSFYQKIDGVIFPSLLECFSATPLEALIMKKILFASDRDFVRDVCGNYAIYFDPLNIDSIAKVIVSYFHSDKNYSEYLENARNHAINFSNARNRALKYLEIINED